MSTDQARQLSENELKRVPEIAKQMKDGEKQVQEYGNKLEKNMETCGCRNLWSQLWGLKGYVLTR